MKKPKAVLIQENIPRIFDATALSNMKLVDVARALETVMAKQRPNPALIRQLLSRVLAGVSTAALGVMGRPEQLRLIRHLNRSLDRIVDRMDLGESLREDVDAVRYALCEGTIVVKQTGKELRVAIKGADAEKAMRRVFPNIVIEDGSAFLEFESYRSDEDRWTGNVYYSGGRSLRGGMQPPGIELFLRDDYQAVKMRVMATQTHKRTSGDRLKTEEHTYAPMGSRKKPRPLMLRALKIYLKGLLDGSHGRDRTFAKVTREKRKKGAPAQLKAIDKLRSIIDHEEYEFKEYVPKEPSDSPDAVYTVSAKKWYDRSAGMVWIRPGGAIQVSIYDGSSKGNYSGKKAWGVANRVWEVDEPGPTEDFNALMDILDVKAPGDVQKQAARAKVRANFESSDYRKKDAIVRDLWKAMRDKGWVMRNKRKRIVAK